MIGKAYRNTWESEDSPPERQGCGPGFRGYRYRPSPLYLRYPTRAEVTDQPAHGGAPAIQFFDFAQMSRGECGNHRTSDRRRVGNPIASDIARRLRLALCGATLSIGIQQPFGNSMAAFGAFVAPMRKRRNIQTYATGVAPPRGRRIEQSGRLMRIPRRIRNQRTEDAPSRITRWAYPIQPRATHAGHPCAIVREKPKSQ